MSEVGVMLKNNKTTILILSTLFILASILRFSNLGYSDYTADEYGAMYWDIETESKFPDDPVQFFLTRKKGPLQYLVSAIPVYFTGDFNNALALRIPFAITSVLSVLVFYLLIKRLTKSNLVGFIAASLLMTSGFIVAFGRIAQYQNLNMLFSFVALFLYSELLVSKKHLFRKSLFGTLALCMSLLAHWDAVYAVLPAAMIFVQFLKNPEFSKGFKTKILVSNILLGLLVVLLFLFPYFSSSAGGGDGITYLTRRFGFNTEGSLSSYLFDIKFYNPLLTTWVYVIGGVIGALFIKKSRFFVIWFLATYLFFEVFIKIPGTHIYNFLLPVFVLVAIALNELIKKRFVALRSGPILFVGVILAFLYYQAYVIYVDHTVEYPWRQEKILGLKTESYSHDNRTRYLIGFPHKRYWEEINTFVNSQNELNNEDFGYVTNESQTISRYYMDVRYKPGRGTYAIGVKRPWSFINDAKFPQIRNKHTVHEIKNEFDETVVRIYRVAPNQ